MSITLLKNSAVTCIECGESKDLMVMFGRNSRHRYSLCGPCAWEINSVIGVEMQNQCFELNKAQFESVGLQFPSGEPLVSA